MGDSISATAASAFGAATSNVNQGYAHVTDTAASASQDAFDRAINAWSETRLKAYLDARGVVSVSMPAASGRAYADRFFLACAPCLKD